MGYDEGEPQPWYEQSWAVVAAGAAAVGAILALVFAVVQTSRHSVDPPTGPQDFVTIPDAPTSKTTTTTTWTQHTPPSTSDINPPASSPPPSTTETTDEAPSDAETTTTTTTTPNPYAPTTTPPIAGAPGAGLARARPV